MSKNKNHWPFLFLAWSFELFVHSNSICLTQFNHSTNSTLQSSIISNIKSYRKDKLHRVYYIHITRSDMINLDQDFHFLRLLFVLFYTFNHIANCRRGIGRIRVREVKRGGKKKKDRKKTKVDSSMGIMG